MITHASHAARPAATDQPGDRRARVEQEFAQLLQAACTRGYHGTASVTVTLQDGHVQTWRLATERLRR
ncbi:MAG: hypothetical protein KF688_09045 [Pirellulales bacterium]|nr:hypothetical protein [Pirellulales bacterium]